MEDKELLAKLSHFKAIKPREEWVLLTRQRLIGEGLPRGQAELGYAGLQKRGVWGMVENIFEFVGRYAEKPAFVIPCLALLVTGAAVWQGATRSLPGDALYPLRAAVEQIPLHFSATEDRPFHTFTLAQQRLSDLKVAAEKNKVKNLPSAIQEFAANASKVSEEFLQIVENQPEKALQASRRLIQLQKEKSEVEKILGTKIGEGREQEIENATRKLVEYELAYLETRSLTQKQAEMFAEAKAATEQGNYAAALEIIWMLSQNEG